MPRRARGRKQKKEGPFVRWLVYTLFLGFAAIFLSSIALNYLGMLAQSDFLVYATIAQSMLFSLVVFVYLSVRGKTLKQAISELGLNRKTLNRSTLFLALLLFLVVLALEFGIGIFQVVTGIQVPTNVQQVFAGLPLYFVVFTVVVAPINEEILFRGFLVPRIGIIFSALIFAALHYLSYNSIAEFIAALVFGLLAGYVRERYKSLYPSIIAHVAINLIGMLALAIL